ncbi:MAG: ATP-binding protein [Proteobacteria bacterium]|nr:ATP-binding protein [Pseudomonadota bacterium]MBU1648365.1 ATP-binding protein [Pseudomonadota bacterium]
MSSGASKTSPKAANSDANLHDNRAKTLAPSLTREKLSDITDEGLFERLAAGVLRIAEPVFHGIAETGTNVRGQTIADPADGILYTTAHDGEKLAIIVHHTITRKPSLRSKWLNPIEGDVAKAIRLFKFASARVGERKRILILTCSVEPDSALVTDIEAAAAAHELTIQLWSGSRLAHVLDVNPDGQWLRHQYLGMPQQRLSSDLLREIATKTIEDARPLGDPAEYVPRKLSEQLDHRFASNDDLVFIQGRSGTGKSVLCYDLAKRAETLDGTCLILNEETLAASISLEEALARLLKAYAPGLSETSFQNAVTEVSGAPGVFLWVEDINRASAPIDLIRKLFRWTASASGQDTEKCQRLNPRLKILCPVWPEHIQAMTRNEREKIDRASLYVADYSWDEATEAVLRRAQAKTIILTRLQASEAARALNYDPLLIGLTADWERLDPVNTIGIYVDDALARLAADGRYRKPEYRQCLMLLSAHMLTRRVLTPAFDDAMEVMRRNGQEERFRRLIHDGAVISIDGGDKLRFRHDRVRDFILVEHVVALIRDSVEIPEILKDPFWAEVIGAAVFSQAANANVETLCDAISPLAVFHAFAWAVRAKSDLRLQIFRLCEKRLASSDFLTGPKGQMYAIQSVLAQLDGTDVRCLLEAAGEHSSYRQEGLARNGCVKSMAAFCYHHNPHMTSPRRDALLAHLRSAAGETWVREVGSYLTGFDGSEKLEQGALYLAGEIGEAELIVPLKGRWSAHVATGRSLTAGMLYAAIRCAVGRDDAFVEEIVRAWASLPEKDDEREHSNPRYDVSYYTLGGAVRRDPSDRIIGYLLKLPQRFPELKNPVTSILQNADHPEAVKHIARAVAEVDRRCEGTDMFNPWGMSFADQWGRMRDQGVRQMSERSRTALKTEWENQNNDIWLRRRAFELWSARLNQEDLKELASSPPIGLEDRTLRARSMNQDASAKAELGHMVLKEENNWYWLQYARYVGTNGLEDVIRELFVRRRKFFEEEPKGYFRADDILPELLGDRDDEFALHTILENWDQVHFKKNYLIALIYLATPESLAAANVAIKQSDEPEKLLEFFDSRIGVKTYNRPGIKRRAQIEAILPYFQHLSDLAKWSLWEACNDRGWFEWRRVHLDPLLNFPENRDFARIDEAQDFLWLDRGLTQDRRSSNEAYYWAERRIQAGMTANELVRRAARYAQNKRTNDAYRFLCDVIAEHGKRSDCEFLSIDWARSDEGLRVEMENAEFSVRLRTFE